MLDVQTWVPGIEPGWKWIALVFAVVLMAVVTNFLVKYILRQLLIKFSQTPNHWDDIALRAVSKPLIWMVWVFGLEVGIRMIDMPAESLLFTLKDPLRNFGLLFCLAWFLLSLVRGIEQEIVQNSNQVDRLTVEVMSKLIRLAIFITAVLVILQTLGFSISGVLAMGGMGGIAMGFAAKDLLANFFGGLIVYLDRPFTIGDWVRSPDRQIEGTVEKIGWRVTMIRNFESQPMYIPNSVFTSIVVENPSRMMNRRIYETIGLRYHDINSMHQIVAAVKKLLQESDAIDTDQTMMVNFNAFADSSVDFFIYAFTKTTRWAEFHQVKQIIMLDVARIIEQHQAEIAFPTTTLHLPDPIYFERPMS